MAAMPDRAADIRARLAAAGENGDLPWPEIDYWDFERPADADLIAHAPDDLAWLLDEVERLEAERGTWMRMLDDSGVLVPDA